MIIADDDDDTQPHNSSWKMLEGICQVWRDPQDCVRKTERASLVNPMGIWREPQDQLLLLMHLRAPPPDTEHWPRETTNSETTNSVVMLHSPDFQRTFVKIHDGGQCASAHASAGKIGIKKVVELGQGASTEELHEALEQVTSGKSRDTERQLQYWKNCVSCSACDSLYPIATTNSLIELAHTIKLPQHFSSVTPTQSSCFCASKACFGPTCFHSQGVGGTYTKTNREMYLVNEQH